MGADTLQFSLGTLIIVLGTFALRAVFILMAGRRELPPRFLRALSFVPAAVFCALIASTLHIEHILDPGDAGPQRVVALLAAGIVAFRTRSILWTIVSGMCALWLIGWILARV
jgi:branched-subunit amino acid transport protein